MNLFGRRNITTTYSEDSLNAEIVSQIITDSMSNHLANVTEIQYLLDYYKGKQDILNKVKYVRQNINNKIVENNAYQIVEFKKGYIFGEPVQYVMRSDASNEEMKVLNDYMAYEDKPKKDTDLAEWLYICGLGYRIVLPDSIGETDEAPFEFYNLSPLNTFVVRSSSIGNKPLIGVTYILMHSGEKDFYVYYVYTKDKYYEFISEINGGAVGKINVIKESRHLLGAMPIVEYSLNANKLGSIEIVISILDALNLISSNEMDDLQQNVNALLVFINQNVEDGALTALLDKGAILLKQSSPDMPVDLKNITQKLDFSGTKIYYERLFNNMLSIIGIPSKNDKVSGGDTGQARLLGEGWTMADERAKQDEQAFKQSEKEILRIILNICKGITNSGIKKLTVKDIDIKFTRNKSDNLLTKTQALQTMLQSGVKPDIAFSVSGLFSDSTDVSKQSIEFFGEEFYKGNKETKTNQNNNQTTNTNN